MAQGLDLVTWSVEVVGQSVFAGTSVGLYESTDGGLTWVFKSSNMGSANVRDVAGTPVDPSLVLAATKTGMFKSSDFGQNWRLVPLLPLGEYNAVAIDPHDPDFMYACAGGFTGFVGIFKTTDGGNTWIEKSPIPDLPVTSIAIRQDNSDIVYIGSPDALWKSTDRGDTWNLNLRRPGYSETMVIKLAPSNPAVIYLGTYSNNPDRDGVWVTENGGVNWERRVNGFSFGIGYTGIISLGVHPTDPGIAIAGSWETGLSRTTDYGRNWQKLSNGLLDYWANERASGIFFDEFNPQRVYAGFGGRNPGDQRGLYESTDGGLNWTRMDQTGLHNNMVSSMTYARFGREQVFYVGTLGGGVFRKSFITTAVVAENDGIPTTIQLLQNYPNPFNPSTTLRFGLPTKAHISLAIYNTLGQKVGEPLNEDRSPGYHELRFNASALSSGVYFYRLQVGGQGQTKKMCVIR